MSSLASGLCPVWVALGQDNQDFNCKLKLHLHQSKGRGVLWDVAAAAGFSSGNAGKMILMWRVSRKKSPLCSGYSKALLLLLYSSSSTVALSCASRGRERGRRRGWAQGGFPAHSQHPAGMRRKNKCPGALQGLCCSFPAVKWSLWHLFSTNPYVEEVWKHFMELHFCNYSLSVKSI